MSFSYRLTCIALVASLTSPFAHSGEAEHALSRLQGTKIELSVKDHGIAGHVNEMLVMGRFSHATKRSTLKAVHGESHFEGNFEFNGSELGGSIAAEQNGQTLSSQIKLISFSRDQHLFKFNLNGKELSVQLSFDAFENNHYRNPLYVVKGLNQELQFKLESEACPNYSVHLIMMILSAWDLAELLEHSK